MAEPFIGQLGMFGFNFPPKGWALCNGDVVPISDNQALYAVIGPNYGGDARTTFAYPELRGRVPVHRGSTFDIGFMYGFPTVTLNATTAPAHTHEFQAVNVPGNTRGATGRLVSQPAAPGGMPFGAPGNLGAMDPQMVSSAGGGQAHYNYQPSIAINFCMALVGVFPSRN